MAHTPTPWALEMLPEAAAEYREWQIVTDEGHNVRLRIARLSSAEDADFIVRAVNSHDALVEALEDIVEAVARCCDDDGNPTYEICQCDDFSEARAALALAKGEAEE